jgi:uncharacterized RDD family membrane protein YckC
VTAPAQRPAPPTTGERPPKPTPAQAGTGAPAASGLVDPRLRIASGLIDFFLLGVVIVLVNRITNDSLGLLTILFSIVLYAGYFGLLLSQRGQTVGMMPFHLHVRNEASGQNPDLTSSALRGAACWLEVGLCLVGAIGWLWFIRDPKGQALHDKVAGTIVTAN